MNKNFPETTESILKKDCSKCKNKYRALMKPKKVWLTNNRRTSEERPYCFVPSRRLVFYCKGFEAITEKDEQIRKALLEKY